ncbi:hypothetical protein Vadar_026519 [Vaccinium darrowii]|uniref:Uncharacterized protein n=1 Tax=Vaccinium darrowii TaxID=229202 RepID=A0ACB7Y912_9ERIC|nr:hypothetical protein Vadar_026519 [Vaccinium darrowii]
MGNLFFLTDTLKLVISFYYILYSAASMGYHAENSIKYGRSCSSEFVKTQQSKMAVIERMGCLDCFYNRGGGRRWQSSGGGFRLNLRRFMVRRLQARLFYLIRFLCRLKFRGEQTSQFLKKDIVDSCSTKSSPIKRRTAILEVGSSSTGYSRSYYDYSDSFYSELAIRECLEFIKMSLSSDEEVIHP